MPSNKYNDAVALMNEGEYVEAVSILKTINGHKDSKEKLKECISILRKNNAEVEKKISANNSHTVGLKADGTVVAVGDNDNGQCDVLGWNLFE